MAAFIKILGKVIYFTKKSVAGPVGLKSCQTVYYNCDLTLPFTSQVHCLLHLLQRYSTTGVFGL